MSRASHQTMHDIAEAAGSGISAPAVDKLTIAEAKFVPSATPESRARAGATKRRRSALINVQTVHRRRRRPGEVPSLKAAVLNHCSECCGWVADDMPSLAANVAACPARECWLWAWRSGQLDEAALAAERSP